MSRGSTLLISGARHWRTGAPLTVACRDGRIVPELREDADCTIEAHGAVVAPGLVDLHVHLREPGQTVKEDIDSGTRAAAAGGFTDVACMPNTEPVLDSPIWIRWVVARAAESGHCRVHPLGAVTVGQRGEALTDFSALKAAGAVALSDDGRPIASAAVMRRSLECAWGAGLPIVCHEEDPTLSGKGQMNEGSVSTRLGLRGIPGAAESIMARRDVELAELTGGRLHLAHLSCASSLEALRDGKRRGLAITGETCPHYWTLTDDAVAELGTNAKMNPPLRSAADRDAVIQAIADGTIDCLTTDHAPHTRGEKLRLFDDAPFGIIGLETALPLTITFLVEPGHISLARAIELWTESPRRIFGLPEVNLEPGEVADLVLFDPDREWTVDPSRFASKGRNTPYSGWRLKGRVLATIMNGRITHREAGSAHAATPAPESAALPAPVESGRSR